MWMMGYNDGADLYMTDSFNGGRKLRPLMPRPVTNPSTNNGSCANATAQPCLSRIHGADIFALNHHLAATMAEQSKREFNSPQVVVSSRWNPTPEQLQTLEDLYRHGTRTPSADQIQQITAQLRRYGKIEGKNVFYWFQNHKARERQKRRRQMESAMDQQNTHDAEIGERKEIGANRTAFEVEQTKNNNWVSPINCSTLAEESARGGTITNNNTITATTITTTTTTQKAVKPPATLTEHRATTSSTTPTQTPTATADHHGWIKFDDDGGEFHHQWARRNNNNMTMIHNSSNNNSFFMERNATWQMMQQLSCPHRINSTSSSATVTLPPSASPAAAAAAAAATASVARAMLDPSPKFVIKQPHDHYPNLMNAFMLSPCSTRDQHHRFINPMDGVPVADEECNEDSQTLQLFPLHSDYDYRDNGTDKSANLSPPHHHQFFEFLPLKN